MLHSHLHRIWDARFLPLRAALALVVLIGFSLAGHAQGVTEIDVTSAAGQIDAKQVFVLDVREPAEFRDGHIVDAVLIPLGELDKRAAELTAQKDTPVIVVCGSGVRSAQAIRILSKHGFTQLQNLKGGMNAWRKANLPILKS